MINFKGNYMEELKYKNVMQTLIDATKAIVPECYVFEIASQKIPINQKTPFIGIIMDIDSIEQVANRFECDFYFICGVNDADEIKARNEAFDILNRIYSNIYSINLPFIKKYDRPFSYLLQHSNLTLMSLQVKVAVLAP